MLTGSRGHLGGFKPGEAHCGVVSCCVALTCCEGDIVPFAFGVKDVCQQQGDNEETVARTATTT